MSFAERLYLDHGHRAIAWQAIRYGLSGAIITLLFSATYWAIADLLHVDPMVSLTVTFIAFSLISYITHSRFSFRGHGARDRQHVRAGRFLVVNVVGFLLNQFFVWLLVKHFGGPTWWPIIPFITVTPWVTFALHRKWVFG